jgi:hypothetical protein
MRQKGLGLATQSRACVALLAQRDPERRVEDHAVRFCQWCAAYYPTSVQFDFQLEAWKCKNV